VHTNSQHEQFAQATAICVNMAIDCVEGDIRKELATATGDSAALLQRLLVKLKTRRITRELVAPSSRA
jgi:hypothetical protein